MTDFPVVGVIGGGQLARMMQQAAIGLGVKLKVLSVGSGDSAALAINDVELGEHTDREAVLSFAEGCDVVTFDHEHVPTKILDELIGAGFKVEPGPHALVHAQDKITMREALTSAGIPCPAWQAVPREVSPDEFVAFVEDFGQVNGFPVVVKTSRGGYDGRGVWVLSDQSQARELANNVELAQDANWLLEQFVPFTQELAAQVARTPSGQVLAYPVVRTVQTDGICTEVVAPAPGLDDETVAQAQSIALKVAQALGVTGMLAVELFDSEQGLLVNELAMRPHNSGHWSIDGAVTSQFENHLRAVLDLPLGATSLRAPVVVMENILGTESTPGYAAYPEVLGHDPRIKLHMYGKESRAGRKLGHVTAYGESLDEVVDRARFAAKALAVQLNQ